MHTTTLLRVKRTRTEEALDAVHVSLTKRRRLTSSLSALSLTPEHLRFTRVQAPHPEHLQNAVVVDVEGHLLRRHEPLVTCNGVSMTPDDHSQLEPDANTEPTSDKDEVMYDIFVQEDATDMLEHIQVVSDVCQKGNLHSENFAVVDARDLPFFESDESDADNGEDEDLDSKSIDYPSTPEVESLTNLRQFAFDGVFDDASGNDDSDFYY